MTEDYNRWREYCKDFMVEYRRAFDWDKLIDLLRLYRAGFRASHHPIHEHMAELNLIEAVDEDSTTMEYYRAWWGDDGVIRKWKLTDHAREILNAFEEKNNNEHEPRTPLYWIEPSDPRISMHFEAGEPVDTRFNGRQVTTSQLLKLVQAQEVLVNTIRNVESGQDRIDRARSQYENTVRNVLEEDDEKCQESSN